MSSSWFLWFFVRNMGLFFPLLRSMRPPMLHRTMGQETHRIQCIMGAPRLRGHFLASSTSEEKIGKTQVFKGNSTKNKDSGTLSHPYDSLNPTPIRVLIWSMGTVWVWAYRASPEVDCEPHIWIGTWGAFFRGVPSKLRPRVPRIMCLGASHMASIQEPLDQRCVS